MLLKEEEKIQYKLFWNVWEETPVNKAVSLLFGKSNAVCLRIKIEKIQVV